MNFKVIDKLYNDDLVNMGFNGYKTDRIYKVKKSIKESKFIFEIEVEDLKETYVKEWRKTGNALDYFQSIIDKGYSIGCYEEEELIGFIIIDYYSWNNAMWIDNLRVSEKHRGKCIGVKLIDMALTNSKLNNARILGLEVQSTNYPAVQLYKKCGFNISGVDISRYPQRENDVEQIALIMDKSIL